MKLEPANNTLGRLPPCAVAPQTPVPTELGEAPGPLTSQIQNQNSETQKPQAPERRSRSKIGRLPKTTRDKLNFMVRDGVPFEDIPPKLGDDAKDITARGISRWAASPHYQRWLLEQDWLENLRADQESAFDLLNDFDAAKFNEAALQLAVTRLFLAFRHIDSGDLNQKLGGNAQSFARLVNCLARASHETTNLQKYRQACAQAVAAELKQLNLDRELSDNEYDLLVNKMDQVFKRPRRLSPARTGCQSAVSQASIPSLAAPDQSIGGSSISPASSPGPESVVAAPSPREENSPNPNVAPGTPEPPPEQVVDNQESGCEVQGNGQGQVERNSPQQPVPQIQNQNSKVENPPPRGENSPNPNVAPGTPEPPLEQVVDNQESGCEVQRNGQGEVERNSPQQPVPQIQNQNSKFKNLQPGPCPACKLLLPPLLKNGERPVPVCPKCGSALPAPPSWTPFQAPPPNKDPSVCDVCHQRHRLDANGHSNPCPECGFYLLTHPR